MLQTKYQYKYCAEVKLLHLNKTKLVLKLKNKITFDKGGRNIGYTNFGEGIWTAILSDSYKIILLDHIMHYL